jgi:hypothetical protein
VRYACVKPVFFCVLMKCQYSVPKRKRTMSQETEYSFDCDGSEPSDLTISDFNARRVYYTNNKLA